jgi:3-methyladenine DNA glycosylase AlkD
MKRLDYSGAARALRTHADAARAKVHRRYFRDADCDTFLGISTPLLRKIAREFWPMPMADVRRLMQSHIHDQRTLANEILRLKFSKGGDREQEAIFRFYFKNLRFISGWDCVDGSAPYIVGCYLLHRDKKPLYRLAVSPRLWDRRIAIVSTLPLIRDGNVRDTLRLAKLLLRDEEDLIHKATGWMLREVGKRDLAALKKFLELYRAAMPRTMLRYAIERFSPEERRRYLDRA